MATQRNSRQTARRRRSRAPAQAAQSLSNSLFRRKLRYEPLEDRRVLSVVTVTTLADTVDFNDGVTSLREAIFAANLVGGADSIDFALSLTASGPATILLTQGELAIADDLTIDGPGADLLTINASGNDPTPDVNNGDGSRIFFISDSNNSVQLGAAIEGITLTGGDSLGGGGAILSVESLSLESSVITGNFSRDGAGAIYASIQGNASLAIGDSTISNNVGRYGSGGILVRLRDASVVTIAGNNIVGNSSGQDGGGIFVGNQSSGPALISGNTISNNSSSLHGGAISSSGSITISNNEISNNTALRHGGGINMRLVAGETALVSDNVVTHNAVTNISGGGIYIPTSSTGHVTITRSTFSHNTAGGHGGGIRAGATTDIIDCTITNNTAAATGGGILAIGASVTVQGSTISGNIARDGGGIRARTPIEIVNSTISGNRAEDTGGGLSIEASAASMNGSVHHSTIANNLSLLGGGIFVAGGVLTVSHSIVANNSGLSGVDLTGLFGASLVVQNSLIGNSANSGLTPAPVNSPDANGNLIGGTSSSTQINPQLAPLASNGGPTMTHAQLANSPALNAGDPAAMAGENGLPVYDQRGAPYTRVYGGRIDIGAFEVQPEPLAGDYNDDGAVDAADYVVWRKFLGTSHEPADGDNNGVVDAQDGELWRQHFGMPADAAGETAFVQPLSLAVDESDISTTRRDAPMFPEVAASRVVGQLTRVKSARLNIGAGRAYPLRTDLLVQLARDEAHHEMSGFAVRNEAQGDVTVVTPSDHVAALDSVFAAMQTKFASSLR